MTTAESGAGMHHPDAHDDALAMVAHDLLTPLTSIIGFSDLLLRDADRQGGEREREFALRIRTRAKDMQAMVEQLLEVVEPGVGATGRLDIQPCDVGVIARDAAEAVPMAADHELRVEVPAGLPPVACDASKVGRVVTNLVSNAVKFSPDGGPITLAVEADERTVRITVADRGVGVGEGDLDDIFGRFVRSPGEGPTPAGSGLGLFVVKSLVEAHEGDVRVSSSVGEGSTFTVELPIGGPVGS